VAEIGYREIVRFLSPNVIKRLCDIYARAIAQRWEGLVLKRYDNPYFLFKTGREFIKLKKDYIPGLSDSTNFVILSRSRDIRDVYRLGVSRIR
jgi:DNA ligase-4